MVFDKVKRVEGLCIFVDATDATTEIATVSACAHHSNFQLGNAEETHPGIADGWLIYVTRSCLSWTQRTIIAVSMRAPHGQLPQYYPLPYLKVTVRKQNSGTAGS